MKTRSALSYCSLLKQATCLILLILFMPVLSCPHALAQKNKELIKVGFIMVGPVNDLGWNYAHNQGRLYLEKALVK